MGRMPYHIHVFLYRERKGSFEFAVFERSDLPDIWQGVSGGGEAGESVVQAALRECMEEAGVTEPGRLYPLDSISVMRSTVFAEWTQAWGKDIVVLPMYFFGMPYDGEVTLSEEHLAFEWMDYEKANARVGMPDQNTALWELNERLRRKNLKRAIPAWMERPWRMGKGR